MAYFPLFINLEGKHVLVVGGGTVAARRVKTLLDFGCEIFVVSPEICEELRIHVEENGICWIREEYSGQMIVEKNEENCGNSNYANKTEPPVFVLAAAAEAVNHRVADDCKKYGIPVNDASKKERCDFYFPGIAKKGELVAGVTASGSDHRLAAAFTAEIRELMNSEGDR